METEKSDEMIDKNIEDSKTNENKENGENGESRESSGRADSDDVTCLKVKADPQDVTPEERKRNVKRLAGAISHSLRSKGEIGIRAFGFAAVGKAAKAIAIARNYLKVQNLKLECSPGFITTKVGDNMMTGISFSTFTSERPVDFKDVDLEKCKSILKVKADPQDVEPEERKDNVKNLAQAINHALEENKEVVVRCFGNATIGKATKAIAIARGMVATRGPDLYCYPEFIVAEMNGSERTGLGWFVYVNC